MANSLVAWDRMHVMDDEERNRPVAGTAYCQTGLPRSADSARHYRPQDGCVWRSWFDVTPVPVWVEDFSLLAARFRELSDSGVKDLEAWLRAHPQEAVGMASLVRVQDANPAAVLLLGAESKAQLLGDLTIGFDETSYMNFLEELVRIARGERRFTVDVVAHTLRGEHKLLRMQWSTGHGHEEDLSVVFLTALDITELVRAETDLRSALRAKDFFLREIEHRVRNTLTLIDSLLAMQARSNPDAAPMLATLARRVDGLAVVHDSLYQRNDPSLADLAECVGGSARQAFHRSCDPGRARLELKLYSADLPIESAAPVALLVSELVAASLTACPDGAVLNVEAAQLTPELGRISIWTESLPAGKIEPDRILVDALLAQLHASLETDSAGRIGFTFPFLYPKR